MKTLCFATLVFGLTSAAEACNVPVFRYALERWRPDMCEVVVFHDGTLSAEHERSVRKLEAESRVQNGPANAKVIRSDVTSETDPSMRKLWKVFATRPTAVLPYVVVRTELAHGRTINNWDGTLEAAMQANLMRSEVRNELARRLVAGHSVVWLMLKSRDAKRSQAARDLLQQQLAEVAASVQLPQGIGLPGSQLQSEVPLLLKFSVLDLDPADAQEQFLVKLLHGFHPDAVAAGEPLLVPVFGRGRALEVIPANDLEPLLIRDLTLFLCGACSCQVKAQNPGFDLLMATPWDRQVFGSDPVRNSPRSAADREPGPVLLTIPPGRVRPEKGTPQ